MNFVVFHHINIFGSEGMGAGGWGSCTPKNVSLPNVLRTYIKSKRIVYVCMCTASIYIDRVCSSMCAMFHAFESLIVYVLVHLCLYEMSRAIDAVIAITDKKNETLPTSSI